MTDLETRILDAIKRGCAKSLAPRAIYLRPLEFDEIGRSEIDNIPVRRVAGAGSSRVYFERGVAVTIAKATTL